MAKSFDGRLCIRISSFTLRAVKVAGKWRFTCRRWPDLASQFGGGESANECIEEFTRRALESTAAVKKLAGGKTS